MYGLIQIIGGYSVSHALRALRLCITALKRERCFASSCGPVDNRPWRRSTATLGLALLCGFYVFFACCWGAIGRTDLVLTRHAAGFFCATESGPHE